MKDIKPIDYDTKAKIKDITLKNGQTYRIVTTYLDDDTDYSSIEKVVIEQIETLDKSFKQSKGKKKKKPTYLFDLTIELTKDEKGIRLDKPTVLEVKVYRC